MKNFTLVHKFRNIGILCLICLPLRANFLHIQYLYVYYIYCNIYFIIQNSFLYSVYNRRKELYYNIVMNNENNVYAKTKIYPENLLIYFRIVCHRRDTKVRRYNKVQQSLTKHRASSIFTL